MAQEDDDYIKSLQAKYKIGAGETDAANLAGKNPEDRQQFMADLEAQYQQRATNAPNGGNTPAPSQNVAQAWNTAPAAPAAQPPDPRADALYQQLLQRSQQGLTVDRNDPVIRQQADAYSANQTRASRDHLADIAEQAGPGANILGEQRLMAERVGQNTGAFEAELMGRELTARRDEIAQSLSMMGGRLNTEQALALQRELGMLDNAIKQQQIGLGYAGLDVQERLGMGGLALQGRGLDQNNDQFMRELALREWMAGDQSDRGWASL